MPIPLTADVIPDDSPLSADSSDTAECDILVWRVHRLREEPERTPLIAVAYGGATVVGWLVFAHPLPVLLLLLALTGAIAEFLFPVSYRLTNRGAHSGCGLSQLFIAWEDVKRATHGKAGVHLSPFDRPSRLDSLRGVRLRYDAENRETVLSAVRQLRKGVEYWVLGVAVGAGDVLCDGAVHPAPSSPPNTQHPTPNTPLETPHE